MATTYLEKTFGSDGNRDKWTYSVWIKRSGISVATALLGAASGSDFENITFRTTDDFDWEHYASSTYKGRLLTNRKFRDPSAWYHIVVVWDSLNVTGGDRMKLYVNGVEETSFATDTNPTSGQDSLINSTAPQQVGADGSGSQDWNGTMAHAHFCDGYAYAASDFGETDSTSGIWVAKTSPSVSYGSNGYFLKFQDTSNFGDDSSGNTNDFSVGAGTMTQTKDSPDNNFPTGNYLQGDTLTNFTWTNGNTTILDNADATWRTAAATQGMASGKWYFEAKLDAVGSYGGIGVIDSNQTLSSSYEFGGKTRGYGYYNSGQKHNSGSDLSYGDTYTAGDIISVALDLTNLKIYFAKNGTWQDSGDPTSGATGTGAAYTVSSGVFYLPCVGVYANTQWSYNLGNGYFGTTSHGETNADDAGIGLFKYDVPAGYYALCTTNLGDQS